MSLCTSIIDESIFNACRVQQSSTVPLAIASFYRAVAEPDAVLAPLLVALGIGAPLLVAGTTPIVSLLPFSRARWSVLRRNAYSCCLRLATSALVAEAVAVALGQGPACQCYPGVPVAGAASPRLPLSKPFAMPATLSLSAGLLAAVAIDEGPGWGGVARGFGMVVLVTGGFTDVVTGTASLAQAIVGALLGLTYHFYSSRTPQLSLFVDAFLATCAGAGLLTAMALGLIPSYSPHLSVISTTDTLDNYPSAMAIRRLGYLLFSVIELAIMYGQRPSDVRVSLYQLNRIVYVPVFNDDGNLALPEQGADDHHLGDVAEHRYRSPSSSSRSPATVASQPPRSRRRGQQQQGLTRLDRRRAARTPPSNAGSIRGSGASSSGTPLHLLQGGTTDDDDADTDTIFDDLGDDELRALALAAPPPRGATGHAETGSSGLSDRRRMGASASRGVRGACSSVHRETWLHMLAGTLLFISMLVSHYLAVSGVEDLVADLARFYN